MPVIPLYSYIIAGLYLFIFLYLLVKWLTYSNEKTSSDKKQFISVIVAYRNENENLSALLNSIANQSCSKDQFELILVDDYSLHPFVPAKDSYPFPNIQLIKNKYRQGKKYALKTGTEIARGSNILTTDADCIPEKNWIETTINLIPESKDFIMSLAVFFHPPEGIFSGFQSLEFSSLVATGAASFTAGKPVLCNGANLAFSKSLFLESFENMYPEVPTGDDIFLMLEAKKREECSLVFGKSRQAVVLTQAAPSLNDFLTQRERWASKSVFYKDFHLLFLSILILIYNLGLIVFLFAGVFEKVYLQSFLFLFTIKMIADFLFLFGFLQFFKKLDLLKFFIPSQMIYPFYIVYSAFAGIVKGFNYQKHDRK